MDDFYYKPGPAPRKAEINPNRWDASAVIATLDDPWLARLATDDLEAISRAYPDLNLYGWESPGPPLSAASVENFAVAVAWLSEQPRSRTPEVSSYYAKHVLQHQSGYYVENGTFVAAALSVGIPQERGDRGSPNSNLGIRLPRLR